MTDQDHVPERREIVTEAGPRRISECSFCSIIDGLQPATILYADEHVVALVPPERQTRVHVLVVPRKHIPSIDAMTSADQDLWWHLLAVAQRMARHQGIDVEDERYHLGRAAFE